MIGLADFTVASMQDCVTICWTKPYPPSSAQLEANHAVLPHPDHNRWDVKHQMCLIAAPSMRHTYTYPHMLLYIYHLMQKVRDVSQRSMA